MKKIVTVFILSMVAIPCLISFAEESQTNTDAAKPGDALTAADTSPLTDTVRLPVNVYDSFAFSETTAPYVRKISYIAAPGFMVLYGIYLWDWDLGDQEDFTLKPERFWGSHSKNGAADKFGHMNANYMGTRLMIFLFRATGSSKNAAILQGALVDDLVALIGEVGDGYSPNYGFDPYDILFNQFGVMLGMLLEYSPFLDRIFTMRWEYFPSKRIRNHLTSTKFDISTDYNDEKFLLTTKLGGIPYLSLTPLRYINIDLGYYTRGWRPSYEYPSRTRNLYLGISINFTIAFGDLLPVGYTSSTLQTIFNYYNPPLDMVVKKWVLSDKPHSEFND